jgi:hypothetical protein
MQAQGLIVRPQSTWEADVLSLNYIRVMYQTP